MVKASKKEAAIGSYISSQACSLALFFVGENIDFSNASENLPLSSATGCDPEYVMV